MLRQKFINRLRDKYQTGGLYGAARTVASDPPTSALVATDLTEKPITEYIKKTGKTPIKNFLTRVAPKLAQYVAPASTALSGIGTGALLYDFYKRGQQLSGGKAGNPDAKSAFSGGRSWNEIKAANKSWRQTGGIYEGQTLPDPTPYSIDVPSYVRPHMKKLHRTAYEGGNKPFHESKHSWGLGPYSPRFMKMAEDDYAHVNAAENKEEYDERMKDFDKKWKMYGISSSGSSKSVFDSSKLESLKDRLDSANIAYIPYEDEITIREQGSETTRKGTTPNPNKQTGGMYDQMRQYQEGGRKD